MTDKLLNVLFICTGNSARPILAEGILNALGGNRFKAYSAGSHPKGEVHPMALDVLQHLGMSQGHFRSKSWDEFAQILKRRIELMLALPPQSLHSLSIQSQLNAIGKI